MILKNPGLIQTTTTLYPVMAGAQRFVNVIAYIKRNDHVKRYCLHATKRQHYINADRKYMFLC